MTAGPVLGAAPLDVGTDVAVGTAPGVAVPVVAADPTTDMDVDTADDVLLVGVADFDPTSAWGDSDEVTAAIPEAGVAAHEAIGGAARPAPKRKRKRKYGPAKTGRLQRRWCGDRRVLGDEVRAPGSRGNYYWSFSLTSIGSTDAE